MMKSYVIEQDKYGYDTRWKVGDVEVYRIIEAQYIIPMTWWNDMHKGQDFSEEALKALKWLQPHYAGEDFTTSLSVQSFLVKYNGKNLLIDTGGLYTYDEGEYFDNLKKAGCTPEDIDVVMFTHLHGDHFAHNVKLGLWSYLEPVFPNARYLFDQECYDFLMELQVNPNKRRNSNAYDLLWPFRLQCMSLVEQDRVDFIDKSFTWQDILSVTPQPGHEPGSVGIWIKSKGDSMLICGDLFHHQYMFTQTTATPQWENDVDLAIKTRNDVLKELANSDTYFTCAHFSKGGFIVKAGENDYQLVADKIAPKSEIPLG